MTLSWRCLLFDDLTPGQVHDIMKLRVDVFIVEQGCPYPEIDGKDPMPGVHHLMGCDGETLAAYCRLIPPGLSYPESPAIGRVIVARSHRDRKLGHPLMTKAVAEATRLWPGLAIEISAQAHLEKYYAQHGFETISEPYIEDGIPHFHMRRPAADGVQAADTV